MNFTFYVVYFLSGAELINLLRHSGVSCSASTTESSSYECHFSYDGITFTFANCDCEWYAVQYHSAWITLYLPGNALLYKARFWFSCHNRGQIEELSLNFSDSTEQMVRFKNIWDFNEDKYEMCLKRGITMICVKIYYMQYILCFYVLNQLINRYM